MRSKFVAAALLAFCGLSAPAMAAQGPLNDGSYACRNKGQITGSFEITGPASYVDSNGRERTYQYDPGLNVLNFDTGKQYFVGSRDLLILVENGQLGKHGCVRQIR